MELFLHLHRQRLCHRGFHLKVKHARWWPHSLLKGNRWMKAARSEKSGAVVRLEQVLECTFNPLQYG